MQIVVHIFYFYVIFSKKRLKLFSIQNINKTQKIGKGGSNESATVIGIDCNLLLVNTYKGTWLYN